MSINPHRKKPVPVKLKYLPIPIVAFIFLLIVFWAQVMPSSPSHHLWILSVLQGPSLNPGKFRILSNILQTASVLCLWSTAKVLYLRVPMIAKFLYCMGTDIISLLDCKLMELAACMWVIHKPPTPSTVLWSNRYPINICWMIEY